MGTHDYFKARKGNKKKRKENIRELIPYRYLIVCEGAKTEPLYFLGIKRKIDAKYRDKIQVKSKVELDIEGTGRNTEDLVNYATKVRSLSEIPYGNVWVVFDKDDFTDEQFNNAIRLAHKEGMYTAWSNEAIELWFVLHFDSLVSAIHRYQYIEKLNEYFRIYDINNGKYEKNLECIFEVLCEKGDLQKAIERCAELENDHKDNGITSEAKMNPCSTVYKLVVDLLPYFE